MRAKYLNEKKKFTPIESIHFEPISGNKEVYNELWEKLHHWVKRFTKFSKFSKSDIAPCFAKSRRFSKTRS